MPPTAPTLTSWSPRLPFNADAMFDVLSDDLADEFENADEFIEDIMAAAEAKKARLDELLAAAWATFVAEADLTRDIVQSEDDDE